MEIQKMVTRYIVTILLTVGFCISIPSLVMAQEATVDTEENVETSDTSDNASLPIAADEDKSEIQEADNSPVVESAEPEEGEDKPKDKGDKKKDEEEEEEEPGLKWTP
jgi:hypothetical protein